MPRQSTNDEAQLQEQPRADYIDEVERWPAWLGKNRSNFGEVDVAPAKTDKVNKVEKWQKLTAGSNPNHMHIFKSWKKDVQSCIKTGMKLYKELRLQGNQSIHFHRIWGQNWQSSQSGKGDKN